MNNDLLLIGGSGRSGTTILTKIFSKHSLFSVVPEWRFMVDPDGILDFYSNALNTWTPYSYTIKLNRLEKLLMDIGRENNFDIIFKFLNKLNRKLIKSNYNFSPRYLTVNPNKISPNYHIYVKNLILKLTDFTYHCRWSGSPFLDNGESLYKYEIKEITDAIREFILLIKEDVLTYQKKKYYLEKNTWNILWFNDIYNLFPEAKLVHIYRDPRDVIASFSKQPWMPDNPIYCAYIYSDIMKRWRKIKKMVPSESIYEVSLESIVSSPEKKLKKICKFWNVEWESSLLDVRLNKSNSGRWKDDLNDNQIKKIEIIIKEDLNYYA